MGLQVRVPNRPIQGSLFIPQEQKAEAEAEVEAEAKAEVQSRTAINMALVEGKGSKERTRLLVGCAGVPHVDVGCHIQHDDRMRKETLGSKRYKLATASP